MNDIIYYTGLTALFIVSIGTLYSFLVITLCTYQLYVIEREKKVLTCEVLKDWLKSL
jgi:hypothetical protein